MIIQGDALTVLNTLPDESVHCCVTSPPYWGLRDYGVDGQLGLEKTPEEYVTKMVEVFREVRRVLRGDGTLWLNIGDSYAGSGRGNGDTTVSKQTTNAGSLAFRSHKGPDAIHSGLKPKDLCMIPARVALALQADGWWVRSDIIWAKPNPMPESVTDRPTKSHEYIFLMSKSAKYYYDADAIKEEANGWKGSRFDIGKTYDHQLRRSSKLPRVHGNLPGRDDGGKACNGPGQERKNKRSVWRVNTEPYSEAHFATFPEKLIEPCILAGCPERGIVLDPFLGSGTTAAVALRLNRQFVGIELNPEYIELAEKRMQQKRLAL